MRKIILTIIAAAFCAVSSNAQLLNRLTERAAQAAERGVSRAVEKSVERTTEKATEKVLGTAEKAVDKEVDKAANAAAEAATNATKTYTDGIVQSANEVNAATKELNQANAEAAQAGIDYSGLMGSYMTLMGAGTPTLEDKGNELLLSWDYVGFKFEWLAKFKGENCSESKMKYTHQTPELAIQYYREQIDGLDKDDAKKWSVDGKTVTEDNTDEYSDKDKIAVKAAMQQIVLSMGGKLE